MITFGINLNEVEELREVKRPVAGGYVCKIVNVINEPSREYLKISFEIVEGEFKGYSSYIYNNYNFYPISTFVSYKEKALPFFKKFLSQVEKSNNIKFNLSNTFDESSLNGKFLGVILNQEEYTDNNGNLKTRLVVQETKTGQDIREGNFTIKPLVKKEATNSDLNALESEGEYIPF